MTTLSIRLFVGAALLFAAQSSQAGFLFVGGGSGQDSHNPIAASADFSFSGGILTIKLTNTSTFDYNTTNSGRAVPTDVLTGLFFDYNGGFGPALTFNSATTPAITVGANPANLKLSSTPGGWDFAQSASGLSGVSEHYGLGTAGFNIFAGGTSSGGSGHPSNFGVMNSLYVAGENNPGIGTDTPYAKDSITFLLAVGSFDPSKVGNVRFQYGTGLGEGSLTVPFSGPELDPIPSPEPASVLLLGMGGGLMFVGRKLRRRQTTSQAT